MRFCTPTKNRNLSPTWSAYRGPRLPLQGILILDGRALYTTFVTLMISVSSAYVSSEHHGKETATTDTATGTPRNRRRVFVCEDLGPWERTKGNGIRYACYQERNYCYRDSASSINKDSVLFLENILKDAKVLHIMSKPLFLM